MSNDTSPTHSGSAPAGTPPRRGILYVKWGTNGAVSERSIRSVRAIHPELPVHVRSLPAGSSLLDKASMFEFSPFEETLFLDADTVVLDRLDFGFEMAVRHGLACCICECPWARRYGGIRGDMVEYNTGVLFFTRKAKPVFDAWKARARTVDSSIRFFRDRNELAVMPFNDQAAFALAVAENAAPFILPMNWNFRPQWHRSWWGPVKIWHDYVDPPAEMVAWTKEQAREDAIIRYNSFAG